MQEKVLECEVIQLIQDKQTYDSLAKIAYKKLQYHLLSWKDFLAYIFETIYNNKMDKIEEVFKIGFKRILMQMRNLKGSFKIEEKEFTQVEIMRFGERERNAKICE